VRVSGTGTAGTGTAPGRVLAGHSPSAETPHVPEAVTEHEHRHPPRQADVVLDVELDRGLLFLVIQNLGDLPAHSVRVRFDQPLHGPGGGRRVDRLQIFRRLEFLGPRRHIRVFLDRTALFFARDEPTDLSVTVTWHTDEGFRGRRQIQHDLAAYRDFPNLEVPHDA
jgi:hypothetical protein